MKIIAMVIPQIRIKTKEMLVVKEVMEVLALMLQEVAEVEATVVEEVATEQVQTHIKMLVIVAHLILVVIRDVQIIHQELHLKVLVWYMEIVGGKQTMEWPKSQRFINVLKSVMHVQVMENVRNVKVGPSCMNKNVLKHVQMEHMQIIQQIYVTIVKILIVIHVQVHQRNNVKNVNHLIYSMEMNVSQNVQKAHTLILKKQNA
ncbi:hypothetical protein TRFO_41951 [Tritrichomonas foetus]|uniref:Uncharacterized protein n=1 Tax=Tritrichomonas foetus TaxID=1144522 RepID=A0A1J4KYA1_9EUKA|nr:hypothetical protein TRFO_41951 [Tritrichomonas foetus]|eukprot:OHT16235.1 hypothetical protein TRFO_41951 [Tritrichomonas foetus]